MLRKKGKKRKRETLGMAGGSQNLLRPNVSLFFVILRLPSLKKSLGPSFLILLSF